MKKYLALLIVSFIALASMNGCKKDRDEIFFPVSKVSVQLNGKTYKAEVRQVPILSKKVPFDCEVLYWDVDSVSFEFVPGTWKVGTGEEKVQIKMDVRIATTGEFESDKWYPLLYRRYSRKVFNFVDLVDGDVHYRILDGMMKITGVEPMENRKSFKYSGEFWFDAVNENDSEDVMTARNGEFSIQASVNDKRTNSID